MPLADDTAAKAQQIRMAARRATLEMQDQGDMRKALEARPRPLRPFEVGDKVAYWRKGKGQGFKLGRARWYGRATIIGKQGVNYILAHRGAFLREAPEQIRPATAEETAGDEEVDDVLRESARQMRSQEGQRGMVDITTEERPPTPEDVTTGVRRGAQVVEPAVEENEPMAGERLEVQGERLEEQRQEEPEAPETCDPVRNGPTWRRMIWATICRSIVATSRVPPG